MTSSMTNHKYTCIAIEFAPIDLDSCQLDGALGGQQRILSILGASSY